ncbi:uncharacterized protein LOC117134946 [Drosophila busckii]|uniref:uncharacterized protein LOC117134946 n=1 Tax=Drosophila busckii TaxID=30019 RepID=UPI0014330227|nr:uncharacterized protein LOC117134946 [Drosophila busckii]
MLNACIKCVKKNDVLAIVNSCKSTRSSSCIASCVLKAVQLGKQSAKTSSCFIVATNEVTSSFDNFLPKVCVNIKLVY